MRSRNFYLVSLVSFGWFVAVLQALRWIGSRFAGFGVFAAIGRFLKWVSGGALLLSAGKKILLWFITIGTAGPLMKAVKIAGMTLFYFALIRIIGTLGFDSLVSGFIDVLGVLPAQAVCALKLFGFGDVMRLFVSTAGAVGTIKLMLKLAN